MATIEGLIGNLFQKDESLFVRRTISREIRDGTVVHRRLVKGKSFQIYRDGPNLERLAAGLHLEMQPGKQATRVPSFFRICVGDEDEARLKVLMERLQRARAPYERWGESFVVAIAGIGAQVDYQGKETSPKCEVELLYMPHERSGYGWFMEETTSPLPFEPVGWEDVVTLLRGRLGTRFQLFDPEKNELSEYRVVKEGGALANNIRYPVEGWSHTIAVGLSQKKEGEEWKDYERPRTTLISVPPRDKPSFPPYLLANGELHLTTDDGWKMTFFPK